MHHKISTEAMAAKGMVLMLVTGISPSRKNSKFSNQICTEAMAGKLYVVISGTVISLLRKNLKSSMMKASGGSKGQKVMHL